MKIERQRQRNNATTNLCVHHDALRVFSVCELFQAYRTKSSRTTPRAPQHLAHERILPVRDNQILDQIDASVLGRVGHFGARPDDLYKRPRERTARKGGLRSWVRSLFRSSGRRRCLRDGHKSLVRFCVLGILRDGKRKGKWWKQHYRYCTHRVMSASAAMLMMNSRRAPEMPGPASEDIARPGARLRGRASGPPPFPTPTISLFKIEVKHRPVRNSPLK